MFKHIAIILLLGLGASLPDLRAEGNLIENAELEALDAAGTPRSWTLRVPETGGEGKRITLDEDHNSYALQLHSNEPENQIYWIQKDIPLQAGFSYTLSFSAKASPGGAYRAYVEFWSPDRKKSFSSPLRKHTGDGMWTSHTIPFHYTRERTPPYLALQLDGAGTVEFKDIAITENNSRQEILRNGSFQRGIDGAADDWNTGPGAEVVSWEGDPEKRVLQLESKQGGANSVATQKDIAVVPGRHYRLSYSVYGGSGFKESSVFQMYRVYTSWVGSDQKDGTEWQDAASLWQQRSFEFQAPIGAEGGMVLTCELDAPGTLYLADLSLEAIDGFSRPDITVELTVPSYRNIIFSEEGVEAIEGSVQVRNRALRHISLSFGAEGSSPHYTTLLSLKEGSAQFKIPDVANLPPGEYEITFQSEGAGGNAIRKAVVSVLKTTEGKPAVGVSPEIDTLVRVKGTPFFPIGLWQSPRTNRQMAELSAAGVNTFYGPMTTDYLDRARQYNAMVIGDARKLIPENMLPATLEKHATLIRDAVQKVAKHPNLLAYFLSDEALWLGKPLEELQWTYEQLRRADPSHPVWSNEAPRNTIEELARYTQACDITGVDIYPVPEGGTHSDLDDRTISSVGKYTEKMRATVNDRKPIWMTLQGFSWADMRDRHSKGIYPTARQTRFMAYNAIIHGATGILYWGTHYIADPEFWPILLQTTSELNALSRVLAAPTLATGSATTETSGIALLHKRYEGEDYIFAINESSSEVKAVINTQLKEGDITVHFEDRTAPLIRGRLVDTFGPHDVHIYSTSNLLPPPLMQTSEEKKASELSFQKIARLRATAADYKAKGNWIWGKDKAASSIALLRRSITIEQPLLAATLAITADDNYIVYINGERVGADIDEEEGGWTSIEQYNITPRLKPGKNVIAIEAQDAGNRPCGVLAEIDIQYRNGKTSSLLSDGEWRVLQAPVKGWEEPSFDDSEWPFADVISPAGTGPWGDRLFLNIIGQQTDAK